MIVEYLHLASSFSLGLLVGSLLTEALILVPYWREMDPKEFLRLHGTMGPKLYKYFAPLTILATMLPIFAAVAAVNVNTSFFILSVVPAIITTTMLLMYLAYFKRANESFKTGSVGVAGVANELTMWARWHWVRVVFGLMAFLTSLLVVFYGA